MSGYILCFVIVYLRCCRLFAVVTTSGFSKVSGYRPALLFEESLSRSRLQCSQFCAKDSTCAGFAFSGMRAMCICYVMNTGMDTVRFTPEDGIESYIKGTLIARFMGPTWGPSGADRIQVGPCYLGSFLNHRRFHKLNILPKLRSGQHSPYGDNCIYRI